jgi:hypothetical protein
MASLPAALFEQNLCQALTPCHDSYPSLCAASFLFECHLLGHRTVILGIVLYDTLGG